MESIYSNDDNGSSDPDSPALGQSLTNAHSRIASRLHSPWWFHGLRGLCLAVLVFGYGTHEWWGQWAALVGLFALIPLRQWRSRAIGFTRANPDRWAFLTLGAPWSFVIIAAVVAALTLELFDRSMTQPQLVGVALAVGVIAAVLGPLADRAGRTRMGHPSTPLPRA